MTPRELKLRVEVEGLFYAAVMAMAVRDYKTLHGCVAEALIIAHELQREVKDHADQA